MNFSNKLILKNSRQPKSMQNYPAGKELRNSFVNVTKKETKMVDRC